jgi:hypothetical protein
MALTSEIAMGRKLSIRAFLADVKRAFVSIREKKTHGNSCCGQRDRTTMPRSI